MKDELQEIFDWYAKQPDRAEQAQVVQMLREIQEQHGCITPQLQERAAETAGVKLSMVQMLIKLYPSLKAVNYEHEILACCGERCFKKNGAALIEQIRRELKIGKDGYSEDKRFYLKTQNCLKHCVTSPNMMVDGELHTQMNPEKLSALLQRLQ